MSEFFDSIVPIVAITFCIGLPVAGGIFLLWRNNINKHEERMKMIENGYIPTEEPKSIGKTKTLRNGMLMLGLGVGAILGYFLGEWLGYDKENFALLVCISAIAIGGLGLCLSYFILYGRLTKEEDLESEKTKIQKENPDKNNG